MTNDRSPECYVGTHARQAATILHHFCAADVSKVPNVTIARPMMTTCVQTKWPDPVLFPLLKTHTHTEKTSQSSHWKDISQIFRNRRGRRSNQINCHSTSGAPVSQWNLVTHLTQKPSGHNNIVNNMIRFEHDLNMIYHDFLQRELNMIWTWFEYDMMISLYMIWIYMIYHDFFQRELNMISWYPSTRSDINISSSDSSPLSTADH